MSRSVIAKEAIYAANSASHDEVAATHERDVPYLARTAARRFYWELLCHYAGGKDVWRDAHVLELGYGTGTYTDKILARNPASFTGVDLSSGMLRRARQKHVDPRCEWIQAPLEEFAARDTQQYDLIHSFSFLHHLPDVSEGLAQIRSLLAPGGTYVALHEIVLPRTRTLVEKLDDKVEHVFGSGRFHGGSFPRRLWQALPGRLTGYRPAQSHPGERGQNLVDYQLNDRFDLATRAGGDVEVHGYSYLAYPWLRVFSAPVNHRALVLRKNASRDGATANKS